MFYRRSSVWGLRGSILPVLVFWLFWFAAVPDTVTFHPRSIPLSGTELVNPLRGYYDRGDADIAPMPETAQDAYRRYYWHDPNDPARSLETSPGVYNFAPIDADLAAAAARGSKFAFRIRAMAGEDSMQRYVPDYLAECGWDYRGTFIPDWNSPCFLDNAANLMRALGARYDRDPRLAWVDIGLFGRSGAWAISDGIYALAPEGSSSPTETSLERIVQMHLDAFPRARKVMTAKTSSNAVILALASSDRVGWRADCLGRGGYFDFATNTKYIAAWPYMQDRWKTAPVIAEFCSQNIDATYHTALRQVQEFHIAAIGNGSIGAWKNKDPRQQENLLQIAKIAGYRYRVVSVTAPRRWVPGASLRLTARWENAGVAPHYEPALALYLLYDRITRRYVWGAASSVDLRTLLPTGSSPALVEDRFMLPADVPPGVYELRLQVIDPLSYRAPLKLAQTARRPDGSYRLGTVRVAH